MNNNYFDNQSDVSRIEWPSNTWLQRKVKAQRKSLWDKRKREQLNKVIEQQLNEMMEVVE